MGKQVAIRKVKMVQWGASVWLGDNEVILGIFTEQRQAMGGIGGSIIPESTDVFLVIGEDRPDDSERI